jgi:tripartite-type tricarboxylate transporter receptor subunit TctC
MKNLRLAATLILFCVAGLACAQTYPAKPIHLIVPFPPGGGNDTVARAIAQQASPALHDVLGSKTRNI